MTTELETRKSLIDGQLRLAGWRVGDPSHVAEEYELDLVRAGLLDPIAAESADEHRGKQFVDYALLHRGRVVAVLEAKRTTKDARLGREQALQYAQNIQRLQGGRIPFVLYSNGHEHHFWESEFYPPVRVLGLPTPGDLEWLDQRRELRCPLSVESIDTRIAGRDYQVQAIRAVLEAIEARRTSFLLVMATGTGKTRTAMALIDVLQRAHWARRVLFLVDRVALRDQAIDAFRECLPETPHWPRLEGNRVEAAWSQSRRLYCATYPTMLNLIEAGTEPASFISPFFFDLVIADESHRSIYNVYSSVLDWFACLKLGLTATPKDHVDHDTFRLFDCDQGLPTFAYSFDEAVTHEPPYLSNYEVLKVRSKFQLEGIKGGTLPAAVQRRLLAEGKDPEDIDFEGTDLERKVTNSGTNALIFREFMEESIKDPTGTVPGKSIFFALSQAHAHRLAEAFDRLYPEHRGRLARVLVSADPRVHGKGGLLDQFRNHDFPRVAISVDMLDTGVDIPEVVNLVFAKPVFSFTKFWQMIGRGTRVLPDEHRRKPWCPTKGRFLIIDCWENFDFFQMTPKGREPNADTPLPVRLFRARLDQLEGALAAGDREGEVLATHGLRADLAELPLNNAVVAAHAAELAKVRGEAFWHSIDAADLGFLRGVIARVLRARSAIEPKAIRFETEAVEMLVARLGAHDGAARASAESLSAQVAELPLTVNSVACERATVEPARSAEWWLGHSAGEVANAVARLAPLMKFRARRLDPLMVLDIDDLTVIKEGVEFGRENERAATLAYRERIEAYVRALAERSPAMSRLADGGELSEAELGEIADLLRTGSPEITPEVICRVYDVRPAQLGRLLRHVLGLERLASWPEVVTRTIDGFIASHTTLTELQIQFLRTLRTFVLQNRRIQRADLIRAPFTQVHPKGARGVFGGPQLEEVIALAEGLVA